ncbi:hypothetical protein Q9966_008172 [Columba livia]|nr:hypothetical protein Q9966_008172 [Columba livia]
MPENYLFLLKHDSRQLSGLQTWLTFLASVRYVMSDMKHPLSPDHVFEDGIMNQAAVLRGFEEKGLRNDRQDYQLSKEKRKILFSFCEVCNIQLNSAAQAQVHYNGKSHLKRVKQLNNGKLPTSPAPGTLFASTSTGT